MDDNDRVRTALGFAMKAGKVRSGEFAADRAFKKGNVGLVVIDKDASYSTKERWSAMSERANVPFMTVADMGRAIGREAHMVACITDSGFANMILRALGNIES